MVHRLDEGFSNAPQSIDYQAVAAMTDIVLAAISYLYKTMVNSGDVAIPSTL